jgi:MoaA/NifB/PqqE/SkfB family radical SAM enzyme
MARLSIPKMEDYSTQGHLDQNVNHLNVHWDVVTICQLKCGYCYARNNYGKDWNKIASKDTIDKVIEALSRSTLPFNLGLLGGEPTIAPHYNYIIKKIRKLEKFNRVYVTTNGEKDLRTIETDGVAFLFSYHPADCTSEEQFVQNVKYILEKGGKLKVNILLHPNKKFWAKAQKMARDIQALGVKIHPHYVHTKWDRRLYKYKEEAWEFFKEFEELPKDIEYNDELFNDYEVYKYGLTKFKGWSCWNNNYEVDVHGNVVKFCKPENTETSLLLRDLDYFKRIGEIQPMICPHQECNCDGLLKLKKVRNAQTAADEPAK